MVTLKIRYISICIMFLWIAGFTSCINDPGDKPVKIDFMDVVSTYEGTSKICKLIDVSADTTCSEGVTNNLRVFIYNENSIILEDEKNILGRAKLYFTQTTIDNSEKIHHFELNDGTKNLSCIYNEDTEKIQITSRFLSGNMSFTDSFEGNK